MGGMPAAVELDTVAVQNDDGDGDDGGDNDDDGAY